MELQRQILLFFAGMHGAFLNFLVQVFTICGEETVLIALSVFIYWNISKQKGFSITMSLMGALNVMGIAKAIVRFPRPWVVIDGLETVRQHTATGYSFPSGHTTTAASAYTSIAIEFKKRWLSICCALMILLVAVSRMFLCVHWPMDVVGGLLIGCGMSFILNGRLNAVYQDKERCIRLTRWVGIIATAATVIIVVLRLTVNIDELAFDDLAVTLATTGGLSLGFMLERMHYDFKVNPGRWGRKILRYAIGMAVVLFIIVGLKAIFQALGIYNIATKSLRYFLVGFWGTVFPMIGKKFGLFD